MKQHELQEQCDDRDGLLDEEEGCDGALGEEEGSGCEMGAEEGRRYEVGTEERVVNMKKYVRVPVMPKAKFQTRSFRTYDVGRPGHTKAVIGRLKAGPHKGKTRVHVLLYPRK